MEQRKNAPGGAKRGKVGADVEQFAADLAELVPALGVATAAMDEIRRRYWGKQPYISTKDRNGFMVEVGLCVAIAAAERGHGAAQAMEMGRVAAVALKAQYVGTQIYFPSIRKYEMRNTLIQAVYCDKTLDLLMRDTGMTHQTLLQLVRAGRSGAKRGLGHVG